MWQVRQTPALHHHPYMGAGVWRGRKKRCKRCVASSRLGPNAHFDERPLDAFLIQTFDYCEKTAIDPILQQGADPGAISLCC